MSANLRPTITVGESVNKSWKAVTSNLPVMVGFTVVYYIASWVAGKIPYVGSLSNLFSFIYTVSMFSAFQSIEQHGTARFNDFFTWTPKFGKLFAAYALFFIIVIAIFLPFFIII